MSLNEFLYVLGCIIAYQSHIFIGSIIQITQSKERRSTPWAGRGPVSVEYSPLDNRGCESFEKKFHSGNDCFERLWCLDQLDLLDETLPLSIFVPIFAGRRVEGRGIHVDRRVSVLKFPFNRLGKYLAFEIEHAWQYPDVLRNPSFGCSDRQASPWPGTSRR